MDWHTINFGKFKYKKYSIPELAWREPAYFEWCMKNDVFKSEVLDQAYLATYNLRALRLPQTLRATHLVQFLFDWQGKLSDVKIAEEGVLQKTSSNNEIRTKTLNLTYKTDGVGRKLITDAFKKHWLHGKSLTMKRLEELLSEER